MAESDRSRSPVPGRNRADPGAAAQQVRQELPFFPRWCGPHAISDLAIATDATASVSTSVSSSVQHATAGTLCWKSIHESDLCLAVGHMAQSTVSTGTSFISSTHLGISISRSPINSTLLTHIALSTHSSGIAQHSIHSIIPAPSSWHSLCELTWWSNNG